jgi:hypothetical protein
LIARVLSVLAALWAIGWFIHFGIGDLVPYPLDLVLLPWMLPTSLSGIGERVWEYITFVPTPLLFGLAYSIGEKKASNTNKER